MRPSFRDLQRCFTFARRLEEVAGRELNLEEYRAAVTELLDEFNQSDAAVREAHVSVPPAVVRLWESPHAQPWRG